MAAPILHVGDTGPLIVNVKDNGVAVNLTGASVVAIIIQPDGTSRTVTEAVTNAVAGEVTVTLIAGDLVDNGQGVNKHLLQIKITFADRVKTTKAIELFVERKVTGL